MAIKLYGHTRAFDDGDGDKIVLTCNTGLFVLYKDIIGNDLIKEWIDLQNKEDNADKIEFMTKVVFVMYINGLSGRDRDYAIANQHQALPIGFALREDVIECVVELLSKALNIKKND